MEKEKVFSMLPLISSHDEVDSAPVVSSLGSALKERGVSIMQDRFPGYDATNF